MNCNDGKSPFLLFTLKDYQYMFQYDKSTDPNFMRLMLPNIKRDAINDNERKRMVGITTQYKGVKAIDVDNHVWLTLEQFVYSLDNIDQLFERMLNAMEYVIKQYHQDEKYGGSK